MRRNLVYGVLVLAMALLSATSCADKTVVKDDKPPIEDEKKIDTEPESQPGESGVDDQTLETMRSMRTDIDALNTLLGRAPELTPSEKQQTIDLLVALEGSVGRLIDSKMTTGHDKLDASLGTLKTQLGKAREGVQAEKPSYFEANNVGTVCLNCHATLDGN